MAIIGGGPGGYEAALVAAQLGADVTVVDSDGVGGSAVLTDCVPSKTLVASADVMVAVADSPELGVRVGPGDPAPADPAAAPPRQVEGQPDRRAGSHPGVGVDLAAVHRRVLGLAQAQSDDIGHRLERDGVRIVAGRGRLDGSTRVVAEGPQGTSVIDADMVLVATGATPRELPTAVPDGERILTWTQVYALTDLPERLVVVGSGVTGAEFASAYHALGSDVVLVSSRDQVLPGQDADAAAVLEDVFARRGLTVLPRSRAVAAERSGDGVLVHLDDGRAVEGSHCLMAVGSIPNTTDLGLQEAGVALDERGFITVDRVSRTSARGVYAAGDCTGVLMLASVAAMQGRTAMWHALGDAVTPLDLTTVSSNVFTSPEIATVGWTQAMVERGDVQASVVTLPLATNARAKMSGIHDGFVKVICRPGTGIVMGGVVVAPAASELIHPIALAVECRLTVDQVARAFTVYPSLSGSVAEAARRLRRR